MSKSSCFGMAGHLAAMSEFLLRGYNVALPYVDRGDDILTLEDDHGIVRRIQVKTSTLLSGDVTGRLRYTLKTPQLRQPDRATQLFYMFMWRQDDRWHWILMSRQQLDDLRNVSELVGRTRNSSDNHITLDIVLDRNTLPRLWGTSLSDYFNCWTREWPLLPRSPTEPPPAENPPLPCP